jgi:hypothetical protein
MDYYDRSNPAAVVERVVRGKAGSLEVGKSIVQAAAGNLKRVTLELGGKSPNIVFWNPAGDARMPRKALKLIPC